MNLFCPTCQNAFPGATLCPRCGVRLISPGEAFTIGAEKSERVYAPIPPTAVVRILVGSVTTLGLYFTGREWVETGLITAGAPANWWSSVPGQTVGATLGILAVIVGGLLAGAGRPRGAITGGIVGLACAGLVMMLQTKPGHPPSAIMQVTLIAMAAIAAGAGQLGARIWPMKIELPSADAGSRGSSISALGRESEDEDRGNPTSWVRIGIAAALAIAAVIYAEAIREWLRTGTGGRFNVGGPSVAPLVSFEIGGMLMVLAAAISGVSTRSGFRHGLICGVFAAMGVFALAFRNGMPLSVDGMLELFGMPRDLSEPKSALAVVAMIVGACSLAGWFGELLLPPVVKRSRRLTPLG